MRSDQKIAIARRIRRVVRESTFPRLTHMMRSGRSCCVILLILGLGIAAPSGVSGSPSPTSIGVSLPTPQTESERTYLGLSSARPQFLLDEIRTDVLVVDFFDMYCHVCQLRAPHMNDFYKLVQTRNLSGRVKIVGVGVGDTIREVTIFKEKFGVPFPVFPDRAGSFSKQFGKIRVPNIVVLKKRLGHFEVVYQDASLPDNPERFLATVLHYATTRVGLPPRDTAECIEDGTTKRCPVLISEQKGAGNKSKSSTSVQSPRDQSSR